MEPSDLLRGLGPHPVTVLGLDLGRADDQDAWLLAALVLGERGAPERVLAAVLALRESGLLCATAAPRDPAGVERALRQGPWKDPRPLARRFLRVARALQQAGGVERVRAAADGLEALGSGLVALAPGLGRGTVLRFLRPLRRIWPDAADTPESAPARAAAACLGIEIPPADTDSARALDLEAALERLGAAACLAERPERCPLTDACPRRRP